jgi:CheY-like chemotaxis protein/anti-sigma regulatory factor (Ser/Thr protein kinase)
VPARSRHYLLRILVADDDVATLALLRRFLKLQGHEVVTAGNGREALAEFESGPGFDLYIIDVTMPVMDGLTLCAELKKRAEHWVPIIMISANTQENDQVQGLDIGADYYLTKPISFPLLKASLSASQRIAALYGDLREKTEALERYYNRNRADNDLARNLMDRIFHGDDDQAVDAQYMISPAGEFSGDMIVSLTTPSRRHYSFVADATGHGLPAALTLLPAIETFYRLAKAGFSLAAIARELNKRLRVALPRDRFIAASLIMVELHSRRLEVWNGGNPPVYLFDSAKRVIIERFAAQHPPLGVVDDSDFRADLRAVSYLPRHSVVACTDGIVETESVSGEMFGKGGLEAVMTNLGREEDMSKAVNRALAGFSGGGEALDDRTLLVLPLNGFEADELGYEATSGVSSESLSAKSPQSVKGSWQFLVGVRGETLREAELSPLINNLLRQIGVAGQDADRAHVCVTELINNAVDHGVLQLDSSWKTLPDGFDHYFSERRKRLDAVSSGGIDIWARIEHFNQGSVLTMAISDSGAGFLPQSPGAFVAGNDTPSGRGLRLVTRLSDRLEFRDGGATAEFQIVLEGHPPMGDQNGSPESLIGTV